MRDYFNAIIREINPYGRMFVDKKGEWVFATDPRYMYIGCRDNVCRIEVEISVLLSVVNRITARVSFKLK